MLGKVPGMQPAEIRESGALLGTALGEVTEVVRDTHRAVAGRVFGLFGSRAPIIAPVRLAHDAISAAVYGSTRLGVAGLPAAVGVAAAVVREPSTEPLSDHPRQHFVASAVNGFWGDRIAAERPALAPGLSARTEGGRLRRLPSNLLHDVISERGPERSSAAEGGQAVTGAVVLFLHGLCESDRYWTFKSEAHYGRGGVTYGSLLREQHGWTPLYVSYNSGLHISANGAALAAYLDELVAGWPVPVTEIALVGHSMGGLVIRSAAHQAAERGDAWVSSLRHLVGLGAPHLGAPLERFVNVGTHLMNRLPETRPLATWLNRRSVGIKDLRHGAVLEADWFGADVEDRMDRCTPATLLPGVAYSMASATLSQRPDGLFAHDLLVQHSSAHGTGRTRRIEFEVDRLFHVGRRTHFDLLSDPQVYAELAKWLGGADGAAPAAAKSDAPNVASTA
jgi:pimeloyl-ACP methyl ester carboxylesterase